MSLFTKKIGVVFLKETSGTDKYIEKLQELKTIVSNERVGEIEKQIKISNYGRIGEEGISFELKNSGMDMYVLHDIYLEYEGLSAQIDYIVITRKITYIIECKNLIGDIEIDFSGAFIRHYELFGRKVQEGIYSPITQNQRHLNVLKELRKSHKNNVLTKHFFEKNFDNNYQSIVVLANPKTCLHAKNAPDEICKQVIRADQLISYIKKNNDKSENYSLKNEEMLELANFFLMQDKEERADYIKGYEKLAKELHEMDTHFKEKVLQKKIQIEQETTPQQVVTKLKEYRLQISRQERIKPYYVFTDAQMNDLLEKMPKTKEELLKVNGFGNVKIEKYGEKILEILAIETSSK